MPLDPQAQRLLDTARASGLPPINDVPIREARERMARALTATGSPEPVADVRDIVIDGPGGAIGARHYRPSTEAVLPAIIFFHGGGWVLNGLSTHDHLCRSLANLSGCALIAVDYRLAPEHRFPAAVDDAWTAVRWASINAAELGLDPEHLGVAGDSSGATLAMAACILARDAGGPKIACQALMYPVADHWSADTASYREVGSGYSLTRDLMIWFWTHYLPDQADLDDPRACPIRARNLGGLPPALIQTAEYDPLRDEGEAYAECLSKAGVSVQRTRYVGMMHGFVIQFRLLDKGRVGLEEAASFLRLHLAAQP